MTGGHQGSDVRQSSPILPSNTVFAMTNTPKTLGCDEHCTNRRLNLAQGCAYDIQLRARTSRGVMRSRHILVGRPGLDPGTLGLKERVRSSVRCSYVHCSSSLWV